ncbi:MAG: AmmeMemoRadiSam system protein B [Chrysiogenales bacterium]
MKKLPLILLAGTFILCGQEIRPVRDDVGFCWRLPQMRRLMNYLAGAERQDFPVRNLVAGISPHDDYLYEWLKKHLPKEDYVVSNKAHSMEHSIEALIPFLQYNNPDIKITPIMVTAMPFEKMDELSERPSTVLASYMKENKLQPGKDIFFLISADANHYGQDFSNIPFGLLTISKTMQKTVGRGLQGKVFRYSDTYSEGVIPLKKAGLGITAPFSRKHWVGFFSAGFYLD